MEVTKRITSDDMIAIADDCWILFYPLCDDGLKLLRINGPKKAIRIAAPSVLLPITQQLIRKRPLYLAILDIGTSAR